MHRSRLAGFIIDCKDTEPATAAAFWGPALGLGSLGPDGPAYVRLDGAARDLAIEVQRVAHASRVHLDIESDDVEAEVRRLEALGAARVEARRGWVVMQAPTGHRFCVVPAADLSDAAGVTVWGD